MSLYCEIKPQRKVNWQWYLQLCPVSETASKDYKTSCHFLFKNGLENYKPKLSTNRIWNLDSSFLVLTSLSIILQTALVSSSFPGAPFSGLFVLWQQHQTMMSHQLKNGNSIAQNHSDSSEKCWPFDVYGYRLNSVLEQKVPASSSSFLEKPHIGKGK